MSAKPRAPLAVRFRKLDIADRRYPLMRWKVLAGLALVAPFWLMYRRIRAGAVLENPQRKVIYDRVLAQPGLTPGDLRAATRLHYTTCIHHLRVLSEQGLVMVKRLGGSIRCYENHNRYGVVESRLLAAARSATARGLLREALRSPDVTPADAAERLGVARSTVKHHMDRLAAWGLLEVRPDGSNLRLRVAPAAVDGLVGLLAR